MTDERKVPTDEELALIEKVPDAIGGRLVGVSIRSLVGEVRRLRADAAHYKTEWDAAVRDMRKAMDERDELRTEAMRTRDLIAADTEELRELRPRVQQTEVTTPNKSRREFLCGACGRTYEGDPIE